MSITVDYEVRCVRCGYHYRQSRMTKSPEGPVCRDEERCDKNIATRRSLDAWKRRT